MQQFFYGMIILRRKCDEAILCIFYNDAISIQSPGIDRECEWDYMDIYSVG
jgi:hypothetical protein